jgi:hypothetical protein
MTTMRYRLGPFGRLAILAVILAPAFGAAAEETAPSLFSGVTPPQIEVASPRGSARAALSGQGLDRVSAVHVYRDNRRSSGVEARLGAKSPALRDLFVTVEPSARPGYYRMEAEIGGRDYPMPGTIHVAPTPEAQARPVPQIPSVISPAQINRRNAEIGR